MAIKRNVSTNWLIGAAVAVAVLVIASVAVALVADREPELRAESTPEGIVQRYLIAIDENETDAAYAYMSQRLKDGCSLQHFRDSIIWTREQDMRISLAGTETVGESREVTVRIRQVYVRGDVPFTPNESSYTQRFVLRQYDSAWRFYEPPWPMNYCPGLLPTPRVPLTQAP